ncbi:MAG: glycosyltransferase [Bacteroidota bacterium]
MKILIVSPRFPYKNGKADSMTVFHLIEFLTNRGHEVLLATFNNRESFPESERTYIKDICKAVKIVDLVRWKKGVRMGINIFRQQPFQVAYYKKQEMSACIHELIEEHQPDILYAHLIRTAEYLKTYQDIPKILAMQIAQTLNYQRLIKHEGNFLRKLFYTREYQRVAKYEPKIVRPFERILIISPHDKKAISPNHIDHKVFYNPHGVDVKYYAENLKFDRSSNVIMMNGDFGVPTNIDGALHFYKNIFPKIKASIPSIKLWLVGRNPHSSIEKLRQDEAVTVTGRVPDIRPYLQQATVAIAPMRVAAGLQNKILVSLASQLPLVSTQIANEGIGAPDGKVLLVAKNDHEFAKNVIHLLKNQALRQELGVNALNFMQSKWTWNFHFEKLEEMMVELLKDQDKDVKNYYPFKDQLLIKKVLQK